MLRKIWQENWSFAKKTPQNCLFWCTRIWVAWLWKALDGKRLTPGQLQAYPWKLGGMTVQTSYVGGQWHQNWAQRDQLRPFGLIENGPRRSQGGPHKRLFMAIFGNICTKTSLATLFGLNTGWPGLNIVSHIWRDQLHPFGPIENCPGGLRGPPKRPFISLFGNIWP